MARFTSIGMPKKTFVASTAEESGAHDSNDAGPSNAPSGGDGQPVAKKRKRRGTRGKVMPEQGAVEHATNEPRGKTGYRDPSVAKRAKLSAQHAFERREKRKDDRNTSTTCFACRSIGHAARDCPNVLLALEQGVEGAATMLDGATQPLDQVEKPQTKGMKRKQGKKGGDVIGNRCYRCNGTDHSLGNCPEPLDPTNPTPYATCFICLGSGHLSSLCPSNPGRGIYVNGGSCKVCGSTAHRAKDCPEEAKQRQQEHRPRRGEIVLGTATNGQMGADEDDFMVDSRVSMKEDKGKGGKKKKHAPNNNGPRAPYKPEEERIAPREQPVADDAPADQPEKKIVSSAKSKPKVVAF